MLGQWVPDVNKMHQSHLSRFFKTFVKLFNRSKKPAGQCLKMQIKYIVGALLLVMCLSTNDFPTLFCSELRLETCSFSQATNTAEWGDNPTRSVFSCLTPAPTPRNDPFKKSLGPA